VGTAGTKDGMDVVTKCGAHHVFNHNHKSYEKKMVEHIGGEGFDVIIEHLANINLGHDIQMLKEGTTYFNTLSLLHGLKSTIFSNMHAVCEFSL
jgi:NADPH:quinone reductase-like Zn-dependent oxidoreductase